MQSLKLSLMVLLLQGCTTNPSKIERPEPSHLRIQCTLPGKISEVQSPNEAAQIIVANNAAWKACRKIVKSWNRWYEDGK